MQQALKAFRQGRLEEAESGAMKALELNPRNIDAEVLLGVVLMQDSARLGQALDVFERILKVQPEHTIAHFNRGSVLRGLRRPDAALEAFRRVIALNANAIEAHTNCGVVLMELGRFEEAFAAYDQALRIRPDAANVRHLRGTLLLMQGNFSEGWKDYEWRWRDDGFESPRRFSDTPRWDGSNLTGKSILIHAEQGIGDEIMFSSCIPDVIPLARTVLLECDVRLAPLMARSFPGVGVHGGRQRDASYWLNSAEQPNRQLPIGSLPFFFRRGISDFPYAAGFLVADKNLRDTWRARLKRTGKPVRVGIAWKGGSFPLDITNRTIALHRWTDLLSQSDMAVVSLQYGPVQGEIDEFSRQTGIAVHQWAGFDPFGDLDSLAALIAELDLVISIDNATVHLAGALGAPTWVLLPRIPNWRWMTDGTGTPWYRSLVLFRQSVAGDWDDVMGQVTKRLQALLAQRRHQSSK